MGFLDSLGDILKPLASAAVIGGSIYSTYKQQKAREIQNRQYQSALDQQEEAGAPPLVPMAIPIPALSAAAAKKASALYKQYYQQSLDMYKPYVETGKRLLPIRENAYTQGMTGLSALANQMLTPEAFAKTNQSTPAYNIPLQMADYFQGARR